MSDTELVQLLEEILRNRRENNAKLFWKADRKHAESSILSAIPSEISNGPSTSFNAPTSIFEPVAGSLEDGRAPPASDLACARADEGGESRCAQSSAETDQVRASKGGELQANRSTESQLLDARDNVRQQVRASGIPLGADEVNDIAPIQRSGEGRTYSVESEVSKGACDTIIDDASSTGSCYDMNPIPQPANVQNSSDMLEQYWRPAKEWMTGTGFTTTPSFQKLCLQSKGYVEEDSIFQSILTLMLDLCESVDTKQTLPLVAVMGGLGLVAWLVVSLIQAGAVGSSAAFLKSQLPWVSLQVAKSSAAGRDHNSAISASEKVAVLEPSLPPILDNLDHGNGAASLRKKQQDLPEPNIAENASRLGGAMSTQSSRAGVRIADPKLRKLLDNGPPPPPQFLGAHAGWWTSNEPGSPRIVGLNGPISVNVGQMQRVGSSAVQQEDVSWSGGSSSGQKDQRSIFVHRAAPPDPWVTADGSASSQSLPSDWQLWQTASSVTAPESFLPTGKNVSPWDS
ncbi:hypothetical protein Vretifemale_10212 [Volvox reticuliferus]|nr:hypothetical protein Vretifemale_10212 [Volvox reticuliferus]